MRVTNSTTVAIAHMAQQKTNFELNKVYEQIATGVKLNRFSDDPVAFTRSQLLEQNMKMSEQFNDTMGVVQLEYGKYEAHLDTLEDITLRINELMLQGRNGTLDPDSREGFAIELEGARDQIIKVLNTQDGSRHVFSGTSIDVPAVSDLPPYNITGNGLRREVRVAENVTFVSNYTAQDVLGASDILNQIDAVISEYRNPTAAFETVTQSGIDSSLDFQTNILTQLSELGGNINSLDRMVSANEDIAVYSEAIRSELVEADYAEAAINLNKHMLTLEASQKTFMQLMNKSLFDLI